MCSGVRSLCRLSYRHRLPDGPRLGQGDWRLRGGRGLTYLPPLLRAPARAHITYLPPMLVAAPAYLTPESTKRSVTQASVLRLGTTVCTQHSSVVAQATGSVCPFRDAAVMLHCSEGTTRWPEARRASRHGPTDTAPMAVRGTGRNRWGRLRGRWFVWAEEVHYCEVRSGRHPAASVGATLTGSEGHCNGAALRQHRWSGGDTT